MIMVVMIVAMIMIPVVVLTILDRTARDSCRSKYQRSQHPQNVPFHSWSIIDFYRYITNCQYHAICPAV